MATTNVTSTYMQLTAVCTTEIERAAVEAAIRSMCSTVGITVEFCPRTPSTRGPAAGERGTISRAPSANTVHVQMDDVAWDLDLRDVRIIGWTE